MSIAAETPKEQSTYKEKQKSYFKLVLGQLPHKTEVVNVKN